MRFMESTIDDWSKETVAQAQKDLEEQKLAWELQQQRNESVQIEAMNEDTCSFDDFSTDSGVDPMSQVKYTLPSGIVNGGYRRRLAI